jgi:hypothetical protein
MTPGASLPAFPPIRPPTAFERLSDAARPKAGLIAAAFIILGAGFFIAGMLAPARGLTASYFANSDWAGTPVATKVDGRTRFWKEDIVRVTNAPDHSSVIWEGYLYAPRDGSYRFSASSDDGSWIYIDDVLVVDNGGRHPPVLVKKTIALTRGNHRLTVKYFDAGGGGQIAFDGKRAAAIPLPGSRLRFYPRPVDAGVARTDRAISYFRVVFAAGWFLAAGLLLALASRAAGPAFGRLVLLEKAALARADTYLDRARPKFRPLVFLAVALLAGLGVLAWLRPAHGLTGTFYPNSTWTGPAFSTSLDNVVSFKKETLSARTGEEDVLSASWSGYLFIPLRSDYQLSLASDDGSQVSLDGRLVLDNGGEHPLQAKDRTVSLDRGCYSVLLRYFDAGDKGQIDFRVREVGTPRWRKPRIFFYPRPVGLTTYIFDLVRPAIVSVFKAAFIVLALFLLFLLPNVVRPRLKLTSVLATALLLVLGGVFSVDLFRNRSTAVIGCDSYAYLNGAELMARNGLFRTDYIDPLVAQIHDRLQPKPPPDKEMFLFSPHGHYVYDVKAGLVYNVFPPGTSMILFPFVKAGGRGAAFFVLPVFSMLLVLAFFLLGARAVEPAFGLLLAGLTMFNVQVFENSVLLMSDIPSLALVSAALAGVSLHLMKRRRAWLVFAGACFGFSLVVRYSNLAGALPLVYLLLRGFSKDRRPAEFVKNLASFGGAVVLFGLVPLGLYTHRLFGSVVRLVYEPTTQSLTSLAFLKDGVPFYLKNLVQTFGLPALLLAAVGLVGAWARPSRRSAGIACFLGLFSFFAFYALQSIRQERYLMPAYPCLGVLFAFGVLEVRRLVRRSRMLAFLVVVFCAVWPLARSQARFPEGIRDGADIAAALSRKVPANAVVFCDDMSGPVGMYAGLPGYRFLWTNPQTLDQTIRTCWALGRDVYFYLDSAVAESGFPALIGADRADAPRTTLVATVRGHPLLRVERPSPAENY